MSTTANMKPYQIKLRYFLLPVLLHMSGITLLFFLSSIFFTKYLSELIGHNHFYQTYLTSIEWNGIISLFCISGFVSYLSTRLIKKPFSFIEFKKPRYKDSMWLSLFSLQSLLLISAFLLSSFGLSRLSELDSPTEWKEKGMPVYFTVKTADLSGQKSVHIQLSPSQRYSKAIDVFCVISLDSSGNFWAGFNYPFSVEKTEKYPSEKIDNLISDSVNKCKKTSTSDIKYFKKSSFAFENSGYLNALKHVVSSDTLENNNITLFVASQHLKFNSVKTDLLKGFLMMLATIMTFLAYELGQTKIHWETYWAIKKIESGLA